MPNIFIFFCRNFTWIAQDLHISLILVTKSKLLKGELHQSRDYRYALHNDVSVNNGQHIRLWSRKIILLYDILVESYIIIQLCYNCLQYSVQ